MRLQHSRSRKQYIDLLQAATESLQVFVFRNRPNLPWLAQTVAATRGASAASVCVGDRGKDQSVEEHEGCGNDE
jgi:hypothetical protein